MAVVRIADAAAISACDAIVDGVDTAGPGIIEIYTGSLPADPDAAAVGTLLGTLTFSATAFGAAATVGNNADAVAASITADASADATGTAGWFRVEDGAGQVQWIGDITATSGGGALELDSVSVTAGQQISITAFTFSVHRDGTAS